MDRILREQIVREVRNAMTTYAEKWVTAEVLCEHIGTLTPRFLKDHGQMFDRTRVEWADGQGTRHTQAWLYPLHKIQEMVASGAIKQLRQN